MIYGGATKGQSKKVTLPQIHIAQQSAKVKNTGIAIFTRQQRTIPTLIYAEIHHLVLVINVSRKDIILETVQTQRLKTKVILHRAPSNNVL